ncbi:MAG: L,D-transpeptidase family protein [Betaproteobacteria bacterium]|nr:L,D-transpeptidase family protein [Betaproteobacteria bacterium]
MKLASLLGSGRLAVLAALTATGCLTADTLAMGNRALRAPAGIELHLRGNGPEALLVEVMRDIAENRLASAHEQLDRLLASKPNFRLAQLIKGDLLMARVRPLATIGNAPNAPADRLADLRDEAKARLQRMELAPPHNKIPRSLLQLAPDQKYAVVVDTDRSTLFLFENRDGAPHYVADYYVTIGRNGVDKTREGDKRTPTGVYVVTGNLSTKKLSPFYGDGAYPISYPNEWDQRNGRGGHGIWLHGTPRDTYSRPPRASDGCVVLTNDDLTAVGRYLQVGITPVIITDRVQWVNDSDTDEDRSSIEAAIESWRHDWESRDTDAYLAHYSKSFSPDGASLSQWAKQKRQINDGKKWIKIKFGDMSLFLYPGEKALAVSTFTQDYSSNNLSNVMKKRVYWIREGSEWKIIEEGAA